MFLKNHPRDRGFHVLGAIQAGLYQRSKEHLRCRAKAKGWCIAQRTELPPSLEHKGICAQRHAIESDGIAFTIVDHCVGPELMG